MSQDIMIEIDSINKRINEMSKDLMTPRKESILMQTRIYKEHDWDYGEDKNPNPRYILLAEEFEDFAKIQGIKVQGVRLEPSESYCILLPKYE